MEEWMDSRHISAEYAWGKNNNFILNQKSDNLIQIPLPV